MNVLKFWCEWVNFFLGLSPCSVFSAFTVASFILLLDFHCCSLYALARFPLHSIKSLSWNLVSMHLAPFFYREDMLIKSLVITVKSGYCTQAPCCLICKESEQVVPLRASMRLTATFQSEDKLSMASVSISQQRCAQGRRVRRRTLGSSAGMHKTFQTRVTWLSHG